MSIPTEQQQHENDLILPNVESSEIVHCDFVKIRCDILRQPEPIQSAYPYYTLMTRSPAVVILGITNDSLLILNEEYRHPTGKILLSFPGGYLEEGEDPLEGGRREFLEETGYTATEFTRLGSAFPYPGISDQRIYYIAAHGATKKQNPQLDDSEVIRTILMSQQQLKQEIINGREIDGTMCTALFLYGTL